MKSCYVPRHSLLSVAGWLLIFAGIIATITSAVASIGCSVASAIGIFNCAMAVLRYSLEHRVLSRIWRRILRLWNCLAYFDCLKFRVPDPGGLLVVGAVAPHAAELGENRDRNA